MNDLGATNGERGTVTQVGGDDMNLDIKNSRYLIRLMIFLNSSECVNDLKASQGQLSRRGQARVTSTWEDNLEFVDTNYNLSYNSDRLFAHYSSDV